MHDQLITLNQAARLLPKINGNYRDYKTITQWCERADIIEVYGPKMVWKSVFLTLMRQMGKLPATPLVVR